MPSNYTPNYNLNQWEAGDRVQRADFNADNAKIDAALGGKAEASAVAALTQAVAGKGNCQIYTGSYTGSGQSVEEIPVTLTFPKKPFLILVADDISIMIASRGGGRGVKIVNGTSRINELTWGENSVSWTAEDTYGAGMNVGGTVYRYVAFLEA